MTKPGIGEVVLCRRRLSHDWTGQARAEGDHEWTDLPDGWLPAGLATVTTAAEMRSVLADYATTIETETTRNG